MIYFNEDKHIYTNEQDEQYTSATQFVKRFIEPFDREKRSKSTAKKTKRSVDEVLAEWEKAGAESILKGTFYHKMKEEELLNLKGVTIDDQEHLIIPAHYEGVTKISKTMTLQPGIYPELLVWSDKYKIAGQADYVEITQGGKINISDYKTSKEIPTQGYPNWKGETRKMKFPLLHLDDCKFFQYALQINLYAFLIKQYNRDYEIGTLMIEHVKGDFDHETQTFTLNEVIEMEVPNLQREIRIALDYFKETTNAK